MIEAFEFNVSFLIEAGIKIVWLSDILVYTGPGVTTLTLQYIYISTLLLMYKTD